MPFYEKKSCFGDKPFFQQHVARISAGLKSFAMKQGQHDLSFYYHILCAALANCPCQNTFQTSICFIWTSRRTVSATWALCVHTTRPVPASRRLLNMSRSVCRHKRFMLEFITGKPSSLVKVAVKDLPLRRTLFTFNQAFLFFNILGNNNWAWFWNWLTTEQAVLPVGISVCDNPLHRRSLSDHDAWGT